MEKQNNITYEAAFEELQQLTKKIEKAEISVDELATLVARATTLIEICKEKLAKTETEVKQIVEKIKL